MSGTNSMADSLAHAPATVRPMHVHAHPIYGAPLALALHLTYCTA